MKTTKLIKRKEICEPCKADRFIDKGEDYAFVKAICPVCKDEHTKAIDKETLRDDDIIED